jgi:transcriptional regulator with XRE-family HTH domain
MASGRYAEVVEHLRAEGALTVEDIALIVGASRRSVSRWARGEASPRPASYERLLSLAAVVDELAHTLVPEAIRAWLFTPGQSYLAVRPVDLIAEGRDDLLLAWLPHWRMVSSSKYDASPVVVHLSYNESTESISPGVQDGQ